MLNIYSMKPIFFLLAALLLSAASFASDSTKQKVGISLEQDLLPYVTGGYFAAIAVGKSHLRSRVLIARVHKPDFSTRKGFTNNRVTALALLVDYFVNTNQLGWWAGTGPVYWMSTVESKTSGATARFNNYLWNGSLGYQVALSKHFYLSPWAGMNLRIDGDKNVPVKDEVFKTSLLNPEASLKIGYRF